MDDAIVYCDEAVQAKIPQEVMMDISTRHSVEINSMTGRYVIPKNQNEGANFEAKRELIEYVNYYKSLPDYQWCW